MPLCGKPDPENTGLAPAAYENQSLSIATRVERLALCRQRPHNVTAGAHGGTKVCRIHCKSRRTAGQRLLRQATNSKEAGRTPVDGSRFEELELAALLQLVNACTTAQTEPNQRAISRAVE